MLESLRKNSRSLLIMVLFGVLIAAFVISLNPTHLTGCGGFGGKEEIEDRPALTVGKQTLSSQEFTWLYEMWVNQRAWDLVRDVDQSKPQEVRTRHQQMVQFLQQSGAKQSVMDLAIERTLWAEQAKRLGLFVSEQEVVTQLVQGNALALGIPIFFKPYVFRDDVLKPELLEKWIQAYRWNVRDFIESQRTEWLAHRAKVSMHQSIAISQEEARQWYADQERKANVAYVEFSFADLDKSLAPSEKEIETFAAERAAELEKRYNARKAAEFVKQPRKVHLQHILKRVSKDAKEEEVTQARAALESAEKTLAAGTRFSDVARTMSDDEATKEKGGWMEWHVQGQTGFGEALDKKIFATKPGTLLGIERTQEGFELIRVDAFREGDISFQEVRVELAEQLYREEMPKQLASKAAQEAVQKIKAGAKLESLFPKPANDSKKAAIPLQPELRETGLVASKGEQLGVLTSKPLVQQAFAKPLGELIGPIETSNAVLLAVVKERKEPDWKEFEKDKETWMEKHRLLKASHVLKQWSVQQCSQAKVSRSLEVNQNILLEENKDKMPVQPPYEPCINRSGSLLSLLTGGE